jgi:hypothetical protein
MTAKQQKSRELIKYPYPKITKQNLKAFEDIFCKCLNVKKGEFELKASENKSFVYAKYADKVYEIMSQDQLNAYCEESLTSELSDDFPMEFIIEIAEDVHLELDFYREAIKELNSAQINEVRSAIEFSKNYMGKYMGSSIAFWEAIKNSDDFELYGICVCMVARVWDFDACVEEAHALFCDRGQDYLCPFINGFFKCVSVNDEDDNSEYYLVYTTEESHWVDKIQNHEKRT